MDELNTDITWVNPAEAALTSLADEAKVVTAESPLATVKEVRIKLKNARVSIEKEGKSRREKALAYQKAVIAKEKELIGIIEPEEDRLAGIEEAHKQKAVREERERKLPERMARLEAIHPDEAKDHDGVIPLHAYLCGLDDVQFEAFYNERFRINNEAVAAKLAEAQAKIDRERAAEERGKMEAEAAERRINDMKAAEEKGRKEAEARIEADKKREEERLAAEKEQKDREDAEAKKKLDRSKKWAKFLADNGVVNKPMKANLVLEAGAVDTFIVAELGGDIVLYQRVNSFTK